MKKERLSKVLAAAGVASRRASETLIFDGHVSVNGEIVLVPQTMVDGTSDIITVDGKAISDKQEKVYYLLNKPKGYTCTAAETTKKRVIDIFQGLPYRLFTVGRLDRDTSGLLIVTNDGHFANSILHPSFGVEKEYLVKVDREVTHQHLVTISKGVFVDGAYVTPKKVAKVRRGTIKITVSDGRKHEVRRLCEHANLEVLSLKRIRIGRLLLGTLPEGAFRPLTEKEKELLLPPSKK